MSRKHVTGLLEETFFEWKCVFETNCNNSLTSKIWIKINVILTFITPSIVRYFYNESQQDALILSSILSNYLLSWLLVLLPSTSKLDVHFPFYLSIYPSIYVSIYIYISIYLYLSIYLFNYQSIYLSIYVYLSVYLFVCLSVCLSTNRHSSLFLHWSSSKFLVVMAACTPSIHVFLGRYIKLKILCLIFTLCCMERL